MSCTTYLEVAHNTVYHTFSPMSRPKSVLAKILDTALARSVYYPQDRLPLALGPALRP